MTANMECKATNLIVSTPNVVRAHVSIILLPHQCTQWLLSDCVSPGSFGVNQSGSRSNPA